MAEAKALRQRGQGPLPPAGLAPGPEATGVGSDTIQLSANSSPRFRCPSKGPWACAGPSLPWDYFLGKMAFERPLRKQPKLTTTGKSPGYLWWEEPPGSLWDTDVLFGSERVQGRLDL